MKKRFYDMISSLFMTLMELCQVCDPFKLAFCLNVMSVNTPWANKTNNINSIHKSESQSRPLDTLTQIVSKLLSARYDDC